MNVYLLLQDVYIGVAYAKHSRPLPHPSPPTSIKSLWC